MEDLHAVQKVVDAALLSQEISAVIVGTGYVWDWYAERFAVLDRKVKGLDRIHLAAACQTANEVALTILDRRIRLTRQEDVVARPLLDGVQLLHVRSFLDGKLDGPIGSDCKALVIARQLGWDRVVLAKRRDDLPSGVELAMSIVRERFPGLIDRGFEDVWPDGMRAFVLPALQGLGEPHAIIRSCLELRK